MTNNKLTDERLQEIYGEAVSCELAEKNGAYMASFDLLCKMDDVGGTAHVVRKLIDMLRAERVELQELRRNYLALRGEIEDVRSQLYEAENQANKYASELQERRKADSAEPVAWLHSDNGIGIPAITRSRNIADSWFSKGWNVQPLYTTPQPVLVVPDEVLICDICGHDAWHKGGRTYECTEGHIFEVRAQIVEKAGAQ